MARDRGVIRVDLWADDDWRNLSQSAQWLYMYLLSSPTLSYAGVADWRPKRVALLSAGLSISEVELASKELEAAYFVVADEDSEEILVRSYLRHDDLLKKTNITTAMVKAFAQVSSKNIRGVIVHELRRLESEYPDGPGEKFNPWAVKEVQIILKSNAIDPKMNGSVQGSEVVPVGVQSGAGQGLIWGSPTTSTSTSTPTATEASLPEADEAKKRPTVIPKDWAPTAAHIQRAREKRVDVLNQAEAFKLHAETHDRRAANWNAAFTTWLMKSQPEENATFDPRNWMNQ